MQFDASLFFEDGVADEFELRFNPIGDLVLTELNSGTVIYSGTPFSEFTISGALGFPEVTGPIFDEINEMYGTDIEPIFKK